MQRSFKVEQLGIIAYADALVMMRELQAKRIAEEIPDTLLILEHPEIVTVGPRARNDGIAPPPSYASHPVDRGGGLTWHGPGQIVAYPIFKWDLEGEDSVAAVINLIEQWVIETLAEFSIKAYRDERMQGVWVDDKKICSIGLSFLRWVSRHGFTINYHTPIGRVEGLAGCGLSEDTTTSLAALGYDVDLESLKTALLSKSEHVLSRTSVLE